MWNNSNKIPIDNLKGKDLLLFKFDCGLCQTENEIICYDFDINFFIRNSDLPIKHNLGCPYCEKSNYHDFELKRENEMLVIHVDSEGYIFEPTPVKQNSVYYSFDNNDITDSSIEWILELDLLEDLLGIDPFMEFETSLEDIKTLIESEKTNTNKLLRKLIFSNVITTFETYVALSILNIVYHDKDILINIVENYNIFGNEKIEINKIFRKMDSLKNEVLQDLSDRVFHNLKFVIPLLKNGFGIDITSKIGNLSQHINIRHDIVHRNGRDKDNVLKKISVEDIENLTLEIEGLVNFLEVQFNQVRNRNKKN